MIVIIKQIGSWIYLYYLIWILIIVYVLQFHHWVRFQLQFRKNITKFKLYMIFIERNND